MANNNRQMIFEVDGDISGLRRALAQGGNALGQFGDEAGGIFGDLSNGLNRVAGGVGGMSTGLLGLAAGAGIAAAGIAVAFNKVAEASERSFEIFQAASLSQMGLSQTQQMANMYASVGLNMENIADQQKDIKDRIGDALTNLAGSMYTDVIQPLKLNILELQRMADSGEDVYAKIYFAAKAQGLSASQMVNMFETMGSDATKRLTVLREYNSEQDYNNLLSQQQITLTEEQSKQFAEYRAATLQLSNAWESWNHSVLAPVASRLAEILSLITSILNSKPVAAAAAAVSEKGINDVKEYNKGYVQQVVGNSSIYGSQMVSDQVQKQQEQQKNLKAQIDQAMVLQGDLNKLKKEYDAGFQKSTIDAAMKPFQTDKEAAQQKIDLLETQYKQTKEAIQKSLISAYGSDVKAQNAALDKLTKDYTEKRQSLVDKMNASDAAEAKKKDTAAAAAAKKADADSKARLAKETQAQKSLQAILASTGENTAATKLSQFSYQQDVLVQKIKDNAKILKLNEAETNKYLAAAYKTRVEQYKAMVDQMIGYTDPNQGLKDQAEALKAIGGNLSTDQANQLQMQQDQRIGLSGSGNDASNPYDNSNVLDQKRKELEEQQQLELQQSDILHQKLGTSEEEYQKRRSAIQAKYNQKILNVASENTQSQMQLLSGAAGDIGTIMAGAFGEGSKAAEAAFAIQRGLSIASTVMKIQEALAGALATPFPANIANYAQILSMGASIITTAKGAAQGQAHSGIDKVPTMGGKDESTWILQAGERVLSRSNNRDLTQYLSNANSNGNTGNTPINVNAPLIVQGSTNMSDAQMNSMLKKHSNSVLQSVRSAQKRNS